MKFAHLNDDSLSIIMLSGNLMKMKCNHSTNYFHTSFLDSLFRKKYGFSKLVAVLIAWTTCLLLSSVRVLQNPYSRCCYRVGW